MAILNQKKDYFAIDLAKNIVSQGEIVDSAVISQSIELILSTIFGERLFNPGYGSSLPLAIHETMDNTKGEKLINEIINSIEQYEDRIVIDKNEVQFKFHSSRNLLEISIPYIIIKQRIVSSFQKKILF